jgi:GT2 family glycosyltransferase
MIDIVLVNFNNYDDSIECLESLYKNNLANTRIFLVDNSTDEISVNKIIQWCEGKYLPTFDDIHNLIFPVCPKPLQFTFLTEKEIENKRDEFLNHFYIIKAKNRGFAAANNIATKFILESNTERYVWYLNNDTLVPRETLSSLKDGLKGKEGLFGTPLLYYKKELRVQALKGVFNPVLGVAKHINEGIKYDSSLFKKKFEILLKNEYPVGASLIVSPLFLKEVGLMNEEYFLYFEELDWSLRGRLKNYSSYIITNTYVFHKEGSAIGGKMNNKNNRSILADYYSMRNKFIIVKRHYPIYLIFLFLKFPFILLNRIWRGQRSRVFILFKALLNKPYLL